MSTAAIHDIRKELQHLDKAELIGLCLRLAKHKTENKELLGYLLFDAESPQRLINKSKGELEISFDELNTHHVYYIKKGLRKMMRTVSRYAKFAQSKPTETQLWIDFCLLLKKSKLLGKHPELASIYENKIAKIEKLVASMHEDLRMDFYIQVEDLLN